MRDASPFVGSFAIVRRRHGNETEWFTTRVRVRGKRIDVWVGETSGDAEPLVSYVEPLVSYVEPPNVAAQRPKARKGRHLGEGGGLIALQSHDRDSVWFVKSLRVRRLD